MTTTVQSPTAGRRRLRNSLRRARVTAQLTQEQVAEAMDWSPSKVIRIETGAVSISTSDLRQLLQLYQVDDSAQVEELVELARAARRRPWWTRYKDSVPNDYLQYVGLEDECSAVRCFTPAGMPGLLQTEEFAKAIMTASRWAAGITQPPQPTDPGEAAARVDVRMTRQRQVLSRANPPEITAVLDEAVLWRQVGGPEVLKRQLLHLVTLGSRPHITVRVLPFSVSLAHLLTPFVILEFSDPADTDVAYMETTLEQTVLDGPEVVVYRQMYEYVRDASLSEEDSMERIAQVAGELG